MTKLVWGAAGERLYETGVDRGVLYFNDQAHAWPGLVSVDESESTNLQEYYQDGVKYGQIIRNGDFTADINALSAPEAFNEIDGQVRLSPGFYAGEQPRRSFGFSYRSLVGNDTNGTNHGYKIHLVYNAMASPASRSRTTVSDTPEAMEMGWNITTVPTSLTGYRPTAHYIIDATRMEQSLVSVLEGILYGGEGVTPRLPQPQELLNMFGSWISIEPGLPIVFLGKKVRTVRRIENLLPNPSFERMTTGSGLIRKNLVLSPQARSNANWGIGTGTGGSSSWAYGFDGVDGAPTLRLNVTGGVTGGVTRIIVNHSSEKYIPVIAGQTYTFSIDVASSAPQARLMVDFRNDTIWKFSKSFDYVTGYLSDDISKPTRIGYTFIVPDGITKLQLFVGLFNNHTLPGEFITAARAMLEQADQMYPYFDGDVRPTIGASGSWEGAVNNSISVSNTSVVERYRNLFTNPSFESTGGSVEIYRNYFRDPNLTSSARLIRGYTGAAGSVSARTLEAVSWATSGSALMCTWSATVSDAGDIGPAVINATVGSVFTIAFDVMLNRSGTLSEVRFGGTAGASVLTARSHTAPYSVTKNVPTRRWMTFTLASDFGDDLRSSISIVGRQVGDAITFGNIQLYPGEYDPNRKWFSGSKTADPDIIPSWSGTVDDSESIGKAVSVATQSISLTNRHAYSSTEWSNSGGKSLIIVPRTNSTDSESLMYGSSQSLTGFTPGKTYTAVAYIRLDKPQTGTLNGMARRLQVAYNTTSGWTGAQYFTSNIAPNEAGVHLLRMTFTIPTNAAWVALRGYNGASYGCGNVWYDDVTIVEGDIPNLIPFHGDSSFDSDWYSWWTGEPHASPSAIGCIPASSVSVGSSRTWVYQSEKWVKNGKKSIRITPLEQYQTSSNADTFASPGGDTGGMRNGMVAGRDYTIGGTIRLESPQTGQLITQARGIVLFYRDGANGPYKSIISDRAPNVAGEHKVLLQTTLPASATEAFVRFFNGAAYGGGDVWWDECFLIEGSDVKTYFDADGTYRILDQIISPIWDNKPQESKSIAEYITSLPSNPQLGEAWDISGTLYIWDGSVWTPYPMSTVPY